MPPIKTVVLADGATKRYRFKIDLPRGADGKRRQEVHTFRTLTEARAALKKLGHEADTGNYNGRWNGTVAELCDRYLAHACYGKQENTRASYRIALLPVRDMYGDRKARDLDRTHIEALRDHLLTVGRRRGGTPGTGLGARSVRLTLGRLGAAYDLAIVDRLLSHNPVKYAALPAQVRADRDTWSADEMRTFLAEASADRLHAAWRMTAYGLRRGEVCGLRWDDRQLPKRLKGKPAVDLEDGTITIGWTRVVVGSKVVEKGPKSDNGYRTLPLDASLLAALRALRDRQVTEAMEAGEAYTDSGYVVVDELGRPVHPEWFTDEFQRVRKRARLPRVRLHDTRHTINSLMAAAGVPAHVRAAWCGHTVAVNETTYTHARPEDMMAALDAVTKIHNGM